MQLSLSRPGETLTIFAFLYERGRVSRLYEDEDVFQPLDDEAHASTRIKVFQPILLLPTLADLTGTTLSGIGLLYIYASVWQMIRGSIIIFTGLLSIMFLGRKLSAIHWAGMVSATIGLAIVGTASIFSVSDSDSDGHTQGQTIIGEKFVFAHQSYHHTSIGILLVLAGQVAGAVQYVIEEKFLKTRNFHPLHVVGQEGIFGMILMIIVVLPIVYVIPGPQTSAMSHGSYENRLAIHSNANQSNNSIASMLAR